MSKICQICTFLSHYVHMCVCTWKTLFFCLNFMSFWTLLSPCVQGVYRHFFHKNFYHFFIFYFFTKFYFSLISRWKFEKTSICTTIWTLFLTLRRTRKRRENINFNSKKDPLFQKFAKICKFWQNFWQFLTIFCKFFF